MTDEPIDPPAEDAELGSSDTTPAQPTIRGGAAAVEADTPLAGEVPVDADIPDEPAALQIMPDAEAAHGEETAESEGVQGEPHAPAEVTAAPEPPSATDAGPEVTSDPEREGAAAPVAAPAPVPDAAPAPVPDAAPAPAPVRDAGAAPAPDAAPVAVSVAGDESADLGTDAVVGEDVEPGVGEDAAAADSVTAAASVPPESDDLEWPPEPRPPRSNGGRLAMIGIGALIALLLLSWGCSALLSGDEEPAEEKATGESIAAATTGPTTVEQAESPGEVVVVARPTWTSGWFQAEVNASLIRELGYTVNDPSTLERDPANLYPAMARGEVDLWAHAWLPGHDRFIDTSAISLVGPQVPDGGPTGLVVPRQWAQENGISSMADILRSQQLIEDLDMDGDGVLDILGCEPDWICWSHIENLIAANGWPARQQSNTHEFHIEAMEQRLDAGLATMIFAWGPDSMLHRMALGDQVQWLSITADIPDFGLTALPVTAQIPDGHCTADPCVSPFRHDEIHVAANAEFLSTHPDIAALMAMIEIPAEDIWGQNDKMRTGESSAADVQRHAAEWIAEHRDLVDSWLGS